MNLLAATAFTRAFNYIYEDNVPRRSHGLAAPTPLPLFDVRRHIAFHDMPRRAFTYISSSQLPLAMPAARNAAFNRSAIA